MLKGMDPEVPRTSNEFIEDPSFVDCDCTGQRCKEVLMNLAKLPIFYAWPSFLLMQ